MDDNTKQYLLGIVPLDMAGGNMTVSTAIGPLSYDSRNITIGALPKNDVEPCTGSASQWEVTIEDYSDPGTVYYTDTINLPVQWGE